MIIVTSNSITSSSSKHTKSKHPINENSVLKDYSFATELVLPPVQKVFHSMLTKSIGNEQFEFLLKFELTVVR